MGVMLRKSEAKERKFSSGLTAEFRIVAGVALAIIVVLIVLAGGIEHYFGKGGTFLIVLAGLVFLGTSAYLYINTGKTITITPKDISYRDRWTMMTLAFSELAYFEEPGPGAKHFIKAHLSDGKRGFYVESFAFKDFPLILSLIRMARKARYHSDHDIYLVGGD
jgi:hypothetical protein